MCSRDLRDEKELGKFLDSFMLGDPNLQFPSVYAPISLPFHPLAPVFGPAVLCPIGDRFAPGLVSRSLRRPSNRPLFRIMIVVIVHHLVPRLFLGAIARRSLALCVQMLQTKWKSAPKNPCGCALSRPCAPMARNRTLKVQNRVA